MGLKSGPKWPYGSRDDVLPIWAHRHGIEFPQVVWQQDPDSCDLDTQYILVILRAVRLPSETAQRSELGCDDLS